MNKIKFVKIQDAITEHCYIAYIAYIEGIYFEIGSKVPN